MSNNWVEDVRKFHTKFGLPIDTDDPHIPADEIMDFRFNFLMEELDEIIDGHFNNNLEDMADGIIDIIYVAIGTGLFMGLPLDKLWDEVQRANMAKEPGQDGNQSKRKTPFDPVIKPEGWVGPDIAGVLASCHTH